MAPKRSGAMTVFGTRPVKKVRRGVRKKGIRRASRDRREFPSMPGIFGGNIFGFPQKIITRLRYHDDLTFTTTTAVGGNVFRLNSLFDPDQTGVGHQPLWRDTFASIWNHYTVISSKITVNFSHGQNSVPMLVGITVGDDSTFTSTVNTLIEQSKTNYTCMNWSGPSVRTLTDTYSALRDESIDPYAGSSLLRTAQGSNPTEDYLAFVWGIAVDKTTSVTWNASVTIEYNVLYSELIDPAGS